jgi:hypothetical protein
LIIDGASTAIGGSLDIRSGEEADGVLEVQGAIAVAAGKNVLLEAQGATSTLNVNNNINVLTTGTISLISGQDAQIAEDTAATVTAVNGNITVTAGRNLTIGDSVADVAGIITTATGSGDIKLDVTGNVVMEAPATGNATKVDAGGSLDIDPVDVTIAEAGLEADEFITITATGVLTNNTTITTTDAASYIVIDVGSIVQAGDITTPTGGGEYVTLTAATTITDTTSY